VVGGAAADGRRNQKNKRKTEKGGEEGGEPTLLPKEVEWRGA
jgi:hypothetical protein